MDSSLLIVISFYRHFVSPGSPGCDGLSLFQGTLMVLASLSEGRLVDKLKSVALLSPVAYLSHMTTALGVLAAKSFVGEVIDL